MIELDAARLSRDLRESGAGVGLPLAIAAETVSTNQDARAAARAGAPAGAAFVADAQTGGRGRLGRSWHSPPGENLYVSFVLRPEAAPNALSALGLVAGLAVADVVTAALGDSRSPCARVTVKWPNDVLVDGRKVAGILAEAESAGDAVRFVVLGVGLNVRARAFPAELADLAGSLALAGAAQQDRGSLLVSLCVALGGRLMRLDRGQLAEMMAELAVRDALLGREVWVAGQHYLARGITPEGRLVLEGDDGLRVERSSGEISLRTGAGAVAESHRR